jgi:hypothetical protein
MILPIYPMILPFTASGASFSPPTVKDQIRDFLDGKTHGESLFHALYDGILDEPIPDRMRGLFK